MGGTVTANDGNMLPIDSLQQSLTYSGSLVATISVQYPPKLPIPGVPLITYTQFYANNGTDITQISQWQSQYLPPGINFLTDDSGNILTTDQGWPLTTG